MCAHYLFDADFCNVASGWEKGVVEKNEQDSRRRLWVDAQTRKWHSFDALNSWLGEHCRALWSEIRHPEYKQFGVAELLEQERAELMLTPTVFDGYVDFQPRDQAPAWCTRSTPFGKPRPETLHINDALCVSVPWADVFEWWGEKVSHHVRRH
jgi:hypothetical protein